MKKLTIFIGIFFIITLFFYNNSSSTLLFCSDSIDEIKLQGEVLANLGGHAHGIAIDDKKNIYIGKIKEIIKVTLDGKIVPFAMLENAFTPEYDKTFIYDIEFDNSDKCLYAASGDRILKITPDGKMTTYIKDDFKGRHGAVAIELDNEGNMYIATDNKIFKYSKDMKKILFLDGARSKKVKVEHVLGLEFDLTFKNLYFCETVNGQFIKCVIKNGRPEKLYTIFKDIEYAPEYIAVIDDKTFVIKDPSFKHFYLIRNDKVKKIIVENVEQKYTGIETIIYMDKMLYGTNYDGGTVHKLNLSGLIK